jgi:hypothetical protein
MAEQEYERLQTFFFKPIVIESRGSVSFTPIDVPALKVSAEELTVLQDQQFKVVDISPLAKQLEVLKLVEENVESVESVESASIVCDVCGGKYSHFNKNRHYLTKKHLSARPDPPPIALSPL